MNIIYGFLIGVVCLGIPMILQYRAYQRTIRAVSDKWKAINDEWSARYHKLYEAWIIGVKPSPGDIREWDTKQMMRRLNEIEYAPLPMVEPIQSTPLRGLTPDQLDDVNRRMKDWREVITPSRTEKSNG